MRYLKYGVIIIIIKVSVPACFNNNNKSGGVHTLIVLFL